MARPPAPPRLMRYRQDFCREGCVFVCSIGVVYVAFAAAAWCWHAAAAACMAGRAAACRGRSGHARGLFRPSTPDTRPEWPGVCLHRDLHDLIFLTVNLLGLPKEVS
jgi:hypothetical protein